MFHRVVTCYSTVHQAMYVLTIISVKILQKSDETSLTVIHIYISFTLK